MVASLSARKSAAGGVRYFENDGYYAEGSQEHRRASFWHGKGTRELGLRGMVDSAIFGRLLKGYVPDTSIRLGRIRQGKHEHQAATDLTLSSSKSVSLAALVSGDKRIINAQNRAARATLDYVERNILQTRQYVGQGKMKPIGGQKLVAATFRHEESRNLDPHLHTHCVLINMVQGQDNKWRTIHNRPIFENKMLIGAFYNNELAVRLKNLGYEIQPTYKHNLFELKGLYSYEQLKGFSTRSADIRAALREKGLPNTPKLAAKAALLTRAAKQKPDREALKAHWKERAAELGIEFGKRLSGKADSAYEASLGKALQAAEWAARHLEERNSVFTKTAFLVEVYRFGIGQVNEQLIDQAVTQLQKTGRIVSARLNQAEAWTTDRAIASEREMISILGEAKESSHPVLDEEQIHKTLQNTNLAKGQKQAITTILGHKDGIVGVQGYAGSGKTTMLQQMRLLAGDNHVMGLAPSASATRTLEQESGIKSQTLQYFLTRYQSISRDPEQASAQQKAEMRDKILVVDEASLASTMQMRDLLRITQALEVKKLVLVGDIKQLDSVEAGTAFAQLQQAGMTTAVMSKIMRQREPELKAAVIDALSGQTSDALKRIAENITEVSRPLMAEVAARTWMSLDEEMRSRTGIMVPTHALREEINEIIRDELKQAGLITGEAVQVNKLISSRLTNAEKELAGNWQTGQTVLFEKDVYRLGIQAGERWTIEETDERGFVVLENESGQMLDLEPSGSIAASVELYDNAELELQAGDTIRWTRGDRELGLVNTHQAKITAIQDSHIFLTTEDGRNLVLPADSPALCHSDYAFNATVHAFQGRTVDQAIAVLDSAHVGLTTQKTFYVEISRARDRVFLITDNTEQLADTLSWNTGERTSALEGIAEEVRTVGGEKVAHQLADAIAVARQEVEYGITSDEFNALHDDAPLHDGQDIPDDQRDNAELNRRMEEQAMMPDSQYEAEAEAEIEMM